MQKIAASVMVGVALAGGGSCVDKDAKRAIEGQPILQPPPDARELWRDGSPPRSGAPGWNMGGTYEVVWAAPSAPEQLVGWYLSAHAAYTFRRSDERGAIRLDGISPDQQVRVLVRLSPKGPLNMSESNRQRVPAAPAGTRSWITLHVDRNPNAPR